MAIVGKWWDAKIFVGAYDLSGVSNKIELTYTNNLLDATVFGNATKINASGLKSIAFNSAGFMPATSASDLTEQVLFSNVGNAAIPVTISPENTISLGNIAYIFGAAQANLTFMGAHGEMYPYSITGQHGNSGYPLTRGYILEPGTASRTTGNGSAISTPGAISATQYLYGTLHVIATATPTTLDVVIQSSPNGTTGWSTRGTFTQVTTSLTSQYLTRVAGPVTDTYWRAGWTVVGASYTFVVGMGIQ